ncbi:MAD2L1-binding protein [Megalops cyprinoides]|uniref:MAD2L1-binding protein n=1 Tax=Megalops cyprinoides TaxID=118141 RepID=UPI001863D41D|nr:MAD2L1-binding protein [Megalops cyprinoides]
MAEVQEREALRDGEGEEEKQESDFRRASDGCIEIRNDTRERDAKSGYDEPVVAASEQFPSESLCKNSRTPCKDELASHITGEECSDESTDESKSKENCRDNDENKENRDIPGMCGLTVADPSPERVARLKKAANAVASQVTQTQVGTDKEAAQKNREDGCVAVVFPGTVTQDSCCKFVCEILKCVLYQRQQLPMTYDQLVFFQKRQQAASSSEEGVGWKPAKPNGWDWRRCQRTLQELEEVLQQLETFFSLSLVPRVLLLLGGTIMLPKELYEVNMENLTPGAGESSLRTSACLRQIFRTLFVADILSDARPVRLMATTVMVLGHRNCGVGWFRPKLDYRVPTRVKRQVISLSCDPSLSGLLQGQPADWEDYVWFQAPVTIKGFCK